ncbi:MAG: phage major capsid protein [Oscillospiraceae bacterium]
MPDELKTLNENLIKHQEMMKKNLVDLQTEINGKFEALSSEEKSKHEAIVADMTKNMDKIQEIATRLESEEKARKDIEIAVARTPEIVDGKRVIIDTPEMKKLFRKAVVTEAMTSQSMEDKEATMIELAKHYMPHLSADDIVAHVKAMYVGSDPDGGYLCPAELSAKIIERMFESSDVRAIASVMSTMKESIKFPIDDGELDAGWVEELSTRTETSTPEIGVLEIPTHEIYAYPSLTSKVVQDASMNLEAWIARKVGDKFARVSNNAFVNGTGAGQPKGFLAYDAWADKDTYERNKLATISTTGATIASDDLLDLQALLPEFFMKNASFAMNRRIFFDIAKLKGTDGHYLLDPKLLFDGTKRPQFLGSQVAFMQDMIKTQTSGGKAIVYGDFREGYQIVDRLGINLIRDNLTKKGWLRLYFTMRLGGAVMNSDALKVLKIK